MSWESQIITYVPSNHLDSDRSVQLYETLGQWLDTYVQPSIDGLEDLLNPNEAPAEYLKHLAGLVGWTIDSAFGATEAQERLQIVSAVDFYKIKGTYKAFRVLFYLYGIAAEIVDLWTTDYASFFPISWFTNDVDGTLPYGSYADSSVITGLPAGAYKTPHFGVELVLNTKYDYPLDTPPTGYLCETLFAAAIKAAVDEWRPANTVPHYGAVMYPICAEDAAVQTEDGYIRTAVQGDWEKTAIRFDDSENFDDGNYFDYSDLTFLNTITRWKLGDGNKGVTPDPTSFPGMDSVILSGDRKSVV